MEQLAYSDVPAATVQSVAANSDALIGKKVHVIGLAIPHGGCMIATPFCGLIGMAVKVAAYKPAAGGPGSTDECLFVAKRALPFALADGAAKIIVDMPLDESVWELRITKRKPDAVALNIARSGNMLISHTASQSRDERTPKEHAMEFWRLFGVGKDSPSRIQDFNGRGIEFLRPRIAKEFALEQLEPVAVCGTLRRMEGGQLRLEPVGKCLITDGAGSNHHYVPKELVDALSPPAAEEPAAGEDGIPTGLRVMQMTTLNGE